MVSARDDPFQMDEVKIDREGILGWGLPAKGCVVAWERPAESRVEARHAQGNPVPGLPAGLQRCHDSVSHLLGTDQL